MNYRNNEHNRHKLLKEKFFITFKITQNIHNDRHRKKKKTNHQQN